MILIIRDDLLLNIVIIYKLLRILINYYKNCLFLLIINKLFIEFNNKCLLLLI
jgi:hypothetical protein